MKFTVNVDKDAWNQIRIRLGGKKVSDRQRSILLSSIVGSIDIRDKLRPEVSDSKHDAMIKNMMRGFI